ncbi:MAG: hypothetical protein GY774_29510 [Planctomycetes bacterium]|nr:hypothetical protein [Planctomycetota bacterium]
MKSKTNTKKFLTIVLVVIISMVSNANADFIFGEPVNLGPTVNATSSWQGEPSISADGLSLYFASDRSGEAGDSDLWVTTRPTIDDDWGEPVNLGRIINSTAKEENPCISADGLELYFASNRKGGYGGHDIWITRRQTKQDLWGIPTNLGPTINTGMMDISPCITADGLSLYLACYQRDGIGCYDLFVSERMTVENPWSEPARLGPDVNFEYNDVVPSISADGLTLFYARGSVPSLAGLCMTTRATTSDFWGTSMGLHSKCDTSSYDYAPSVSADGSTLYFESCRAGSFGDSDIWQMSIEPVVDFNGDGIVSALDIAIMIAHWGQDHPLCDIGPTPLGDRIVDVHDLIVLTDHLCLEIPPVE